MGEPIPVTDEPTNSPKVDKKSKTTEKQDKESVSAKKPASVQKKPERLQKGGKSSESPSTKRTNSPAASRRGSPAPSPVLKRQSSRNSLYKPSDESDKCEESENEDEEKPKDGKRRSARM